MKINVTKKDILFNYISTTLNILLGILFIPIIIKTLKSYEVGLWYVFTNVSSFVLLADFGFSQTIMRNISYCWSGAKELASDGLNNSFISDHINYDLLDKVIKVSKKIYLYISIFVILLCLTIGSFYIHFLLFKEGVSLYTLYSGLLSWLLYSGAIFINMYYSYWTPILKGIGAIKETSIANIIAKSIYVILGYIGLLNNGGLVWVSFIYLISGMLFTYTNKLFFKKKIEKNINLKSKLEKKDFIKIFNILWPNAKKLGIVMIGSFLINKSTTIICSLFLGLEVTAQYGLSLQLLGIIYSFAQILYNGYIPELTYLKVNNKKTQYINLLSKSLVVQWFIGISGSLIFILIGPYLLQLIKTNVKLLDINSLLLLAIILFLENNHSTFANIITLSNKVPFVSASIISGVMIIISSTLVLKFANVGIIGLILSQGIIQLAYNNWYWPYYVLKENNITIFDIIKYGVRQVL